ncbi:hypothetical protein CVT26_011098 [Gymnopilus dilepis]|uniref:Uncharacterized protein n=1 Tax=Gymnopilus dilepis TaxID=231916 RepID=A0A409VJF9_9AGAR|nr:hypothetical protein CVT26_011098 [Gymnopilus dilepis]
MTTSDVGMASWIFLVNGFTYTTLYPTPDWPQVNQSATWLSIRIWGSKELRAAREKGKDGHPSRQQDEP